MLMNDFYMIHHLQQQDDSLSCVISFNDKHEIFKGHFPNQPVVPGVCIMQIIKELLEQELKQKFLMSNISQVKFLQVITPEVQATVNINWMENEKGYMVNASFKTDKDLFKLSGEFAMI